jgi:transcriptional repressor of cell division inhibition gene dicB
MLKKDVIAYYGSSGQVAQALEISRQAVEKWPDVVPEGSAYKLQVITNEALRVNPLLYGKNPSAHATHAAA